MFEIEKLRKSRGLTLQALAVKIGCSLNYVWRVERGRANPTKNFLQKMADALEVTLSELLAAPPQEAA